MTKRDMTLPIPPRSRILFTNKRVKLEQDILKSELRVKSELRK